MGALLLAKVIFIFVFTIFSTASLAQSYDLAVQYYYGSRFKTSSENGVSVSGSDKDSQYFSIDLFTDTKSNISVGTANLFFGAGFGAFIYNSSLSESESKSYAVDLHVGAKINFADGPIFLGAAFGAALHNIINRRSDLKKNPNGSMFQADLGISISLADILFGYRFYDIKADETLSGPFAGLRLIF